MSENGPSPLTQTVAQRLRDLAGLPPSPKGLEAALRLLAKWRAQVLGNTLRARNGTIVLAGPFKGMDYCVAASEGGWSSRLLGVYESNLIPVIEAVVARAYPQIIDVGSAEGYYAIGLARRMPGAQVHAHDIDPNARALAATLAAANGVADRVHIAGALDPAGFDLCRHAPTFVLCDIEGAEDALLDPVAAPGLAFADILVEVHEGIHPGLTDRLTARFAATHDITRIGRRLDASTLPDWTETLGDLDRLLMLWEWRASPTPWLWMQRKDCAS